MSYVFRRPSQLRWGASNSLILGEGEDEEEGGGGEISFLSLNDLTILSAMLSFGLFLILFEFLESFRIFWIFLGFLEFFVILRILSDSFESTSSWELLRVPVSY